MDKSGKFAEWEEIRLRTSGRRKLKSHAKKAHPHPLLPTHSFIIGHGLKHLRGLFPSSSSSSSKAMTKGLKVRLSERGRTAATTMTIRVEFECVRCQFQFIDQLSARTDWGGPRE